ncbi:hypothetical protein JW752_03545 [Candidatus Peregrinibacteria bacterium]|nr:hypothetical protein [Candidatus Peregrinibacteria bacterium]
MKRTKKTVKKCRGGLVILIRALVGGLALAALVLFVSTAEKPTINWGFLIKGGHEVVSIDDGLTIGEAVLVRIDENDEPIFLRDGKPTFARGEQVIFALLNTGPFVKGDDGLYSFEMDIEVTGPDGKVVMDKKESLSGAGHMELENGYAAEPNGVFIGSPYSDIGDYNFKLTIYDKIGTGRAVRTAPFFLK